MKWFKVWNEDRVLRKAVKANSLENLKLGGAKKLGLDENVLIRVVLEEDGTEIDDDEYLFCLPENTKIILLPVGSKWKYHCDSFTPSSLDVTDGTTPEDLLSIFDRLRQDISQIVLLTNEEMSLFINYEPELIANHLKKSMSEVHILQEKCQELLDEKFRMDETKNLLQLIKNNSQFNLTD